MNIIFNINEIKPVAEKVWRQFSYRKIWAFYAEMGAGKTTFIHALCETLGVNDAISSPTFAIINEYKSPVTGTIYHMDWYRIKNAEEARRAGVEDCLLSGDLCLIEWAEKAAELLPQDVLNIYIETIYQNTRKIKISF